MGIVVRWDAENGRKDIRPVALHNDGWRIGGMPGPRPLYHLPALANSIRVYLCEGEKAVDAARSIGLVATTSAHGSASPHKTDWQPLAGKDVIILPDNDMPGQKYAETVASLLEKLNPPPSVRIVELPGLPDGGDMVEWINEHGDAAEPNSMREEIEALTSTAVHENEPSPVIDAFEPFPVDFLPEPVRSFVTVCTRSIKCDPSYLALPVLTMLASAIGTTRRIQLKRGWSAPPIIWSAIVGESGTSKSPAFKEVMRPLKALQEKAWKRHKEAMCDYETNLACWEKRCNDWKKKPKDFGDPPTKPEEPHAERFFVSDVTIEALVPLLQSNQRGLLVACDELSGWFGSFDRYRSGKGGADSANWLSLFNGESIINDRKGDSKSGPRTIYVPRTSVCVCGGIQPAILNRALGLEHRESGLAARLLLSYPPKLAKRWTEDDIDPVVEEKFAKLIHRLYELQPVVSDEGEIHPQLIQLTDDAKREFIIYYNAHGIEQADLTGDLCAAWSKLEEYAARLALVIHFIRWAARDPTLESADEVDVASMRAGIRLAQWFKNEARRVYAMLSETEDESNRRRLVEFLSRKRVPVTVRDVQVGCRWIKTAKESEAALKELVKLGWGRWDTTPTGKPGRPATKFHLSTLSTSTEIRNPLQK